MLTFEAGLSTQCRFTLEGELDEGPVSIASEGQNRRHHGRHVGQLLRCRYQNAPSRSRREAGHEPWPVTIASVPSGLPNEVDELRVTISNVAVQFSIFYIGVNCLFQGNMPIEFDVEGRNPYATGLGGILATGFSSAEAALAAPAAVPSEAPST